MPRVVFLLVPHVHLLDLAGPAQVFSAADDLGYSHTLHYVSERQQVPTVQGLALGASTTWPDLHAGDLVVVPGWRAPVHTPTKATLRRLSDHHAAGGTVVGVCAGADALGQAGLLDGRRCTTLHTVQDELARRYPKARVQRDVLYVDDERVVTSAGVASGLDVALHLVNKRHGPYAASRVARAMIVHARRSGTAEQVSMLLRRRSHVDETVHHLQDVIESRFTEALPLRDLAVIARCSERTVTRLFRQATGLTPLAYQTALRLEQAEYLIGQGATMDSAARQAGFHDARTLRRLRSRTHTG
ncbi:GlxA family transcriptional regulator [Nonomuraea sp. NPDC050663]|uniref:GlxA family transcriptional regulator n=1 Tax=Nonomuraea sp. NPDC050663 TaxID=3364370 RepID=UPI003798AA62